MTDLPKKNKNSKMKIKNSKNRKEVINDCKLNCYQIKKTIYDTTMKEKFSEDKKKKIEGKFDEVLKWVNVNLAVSKEE